MDEGRFYALLRFEEASLALRTALRLNLVDQLGERKYSLDQITEEFGFTFQAGRTFFSLLHVMGVLNRIDEDFQVSQMASTCLADQLASSRKPYLAMGTGDDVDALVDLLRGNVSAEDQPLYGTEDGGPTLMDNEPIGREVAFGLASRARNFSGPLSQCIAKFATGLSTVADVGAGSPFVSAACLSRMDWLEKATLVDRPNGMKFAREMIETEGIESKRMEFCEIDFFGSVPPSDIFILSNTAHDWLVQEYTQIIQNIARVIPANGVICVHEPLLLSQWNSDTEWIRALWMNCYALTLFRLTLGKGTCYTLEEHFTVLKDCGFQLLDEPAPTSDGCTALFFGKNK